MGSSPVALVLRDLLVNPSSGIKWENIFLEINSKILPEGFIDNILTKVFTGIILPQELTVKSNPSSGIHW
jgi:hypothetical protein